MTKKNLMKAIELAKDPGGCRYVKNGKPCCVVAQLAALEGVSVKTLKTLDRENGGIRIQLALEDGRIAIPGKYPMTLLRALQTTWDVYGGDAVASEQRARMRRIVERHFKRKAKRKAT